MSNATYAREGALALLAARLPVKAVFEEQLDAAHLAGVKLIVAAGIDATLPKTNARLRDWVEKGGTLLTVENTLDQTEFGTLAKDAFVTGRDEFDHRACDRLDAIGRWMHANGRAIYGCGKAPDEFTAPPETQLTYDKETNRLYIHLLNYPSEFLPVSFADKIEYAQFLHDGSEIKIQHGETYGHSQGGDLGKNDFLLLPARKPNVEIPVIEVFLKK